MIVSSLVHNRYIPLIALLLSTIICIAVSHIILHHGYTIIFQNLFYIPIILACIFYIWRGFLFSVLLAVFYFLLITTHVPDPVIFLEAFTRVIFFIGIAGVVSILAGISRRSEDTIHELAGFQESIINNARVWLTVLDQKGTILLWNRAAEEISGYDSSEVCADNGIWKRLYPKREYRRAITATIQGILDTKEYFQHFETTVLTKNGDERIISWNTNRIPHKKDTTPAFVAIGVDITDKKRAEASLCEANKNLEDLISIANVPIIVWDPDLRITRLNHSCELLIGRSADEVLGKSLELLFPPDQADCSLHMLRKTLEGVRWETVAIDIRHKNGTIRNVLWNSATLYTKNGTDYPVATIAQGRDITDIRRVEQEREVAVMQIQKNLAQLAILNDGIRNPLTVIVSYTEFFGDKSLLEVIQSQTKKINEMVTQLDQRWIESESVLQVLRKHYHIYTDVLQEQDEGVPLSGFEP